MKKVLLLLSIGFLFSCSKIYAQDYVKYYEMKDLNPPEKTGEFSWTKLAEDPEGDARVAGKSDGKALYYHYEGDTDTIWFRFDLHNQPNPTAFALNVLIDTDADQSNGANWFAVNKGFKLERMISYWMRLNDGRLQGVNGITDAQGFQSRQWSKLSDGSIDFYLDKVNKSYIIGVKRTDIAPNLDKFNVIGAVGEYTSWNDDVPNSGYGTVEIN